jgi:multidrug transporter EmrE-like cation transporter
MAMKYAGIHSPQGGVDLYFSKYFLLTLVLFGLNLLFFSQALRQIPMFIGYPILVGVSIILITCASSILFSETPSYSQILGILLLMLGIFLTVR